MKIDAPWLSSPASEAIFKGFERAGKQVYFVGGCVRNSLLQAPVSDLDLATNALPPETMQIARDAGLQAIPTGIDHGTITVVSSGKPYEITTFRKDVETDGRRAVVAFADNMSDDAKRRDFTMNALYAAADGTVIDPLNGMADLQARRVRFIGSATRRIKEDSLRILRFFRFYAWYGDPAEGLDPEGLAACAAGAQSIENLSKERLGAEMRKLLGAADPAPAVAAMAQSGVLTRVLPGADATALPVLIHLEQVAGLAPDHLRRLAILGDCGAEQHLRLGKSDAKSLNILRDIIATDPRPAVAGYRFGAKLALDGAILHAALLSRPFDSEITKEIQRGAGAVFPVRASDLMPEYQGKNLGDKLRSLEADWLQSGLTATRDELLH